jgi:hypothetical protein
VKSLSPSPSKKSKSDWNPNVSVGSRLFQKASALDSVLFKSHEDEEVINTPFCPLQKKFHTFVLRGLRNISEAP